MALAVRHPDSRVGPCGPAAVETRWTGDRRVSGVSGGPMQGYKRVVRRLLYRLWPLLPPPVQRLAVRLLRPKVTLGACAVIRDGHGRVLLTHHTYRQPAWGLPGGFVGRNEQAMSALAREIREELSVPADIGPLLWADISRHGHHLTLYYHASIHGTPRADGDEIDGYHYAALAELPCVLPVSARSWLPALTEQPVARTCQASLPRRVRRSRPREMATSRKTIAAPAGLYYIGDAQSTTATKRKMAETTAASSLSLGHQDSSGDCGCDARRGG